MLKARDLSTYDPPGGYFTEKKLVDGTTAYIAHLRIGDDERRWVSDFLGDMYARGFLNPQEHEARQEQAGKAATRSQLNVLISDLPEDPEEWRKRRRARPDPEALRREVEASIPASIAPSLLMIIFALCVLAFGIVELALPNFLAHDAIGCAAIIIAVATVLREGTN